MFPLQRHCGPEKRQMSRLRPENWGLGFEEVLEDLLARGVGFIEQFGMELDAEQRH